MINHALGDESQAKRDGTFKYGTYLFHFARRGGGGGGSKIAKNNVPFTTYQ